MVFRRLHEDNNVLLQTCNWKTGNDRNVLSVNANLGVSFVLVDCSMVSRLVGYGLISVCGGLRPRAAPCFHRILEQP